LDQGLWSHFFHMVAEQKSWSRDAGIEFEQQIWSTYVLSAALKQINYDMEIH
jgi:hypothetical protein